MGDFHREIAFFSWLNGGFSKRKCMIFRLHGRFFEEKMRDLQVKWEILVGKMFDFGVK